MFFMTRCWIDIFIGYQLMAWYSGTSKEGETPEFLLLVPVIAPILSSNKLIFCEKVQYEGGQISIKRLSEDESESIRLW